MTFGRNGIRAKAFGVPPQRFRLVDRRWVPSLEKIDRHYSGSYPFTEVLLCGVHWRPGLALLLRLASRVRLRHIVIRESLPEPPPLPVGFFLFVIFPQLTNVFQPRFWIRVSV